jgi:large subunit ribosomal protein L29
MTRPSELREMPDDALLEHIEEVRQELFGLRFKNATSELENTARIRHARKDLARALTIANERGLDTSIRRKRDDG